MASTPLVRRRAGHIFRGHVAVAFYFGAFLRTSPRHQGSYGAGRLLASVASYGDH